MAPDTANHMINNNLHKTYSKLIETQKNLTRALTYINLNISVTDDNFQETNIKLLTDINNFSTLNNNPETTEILNNIMSVSRDLSAIILMNTIHQKSWIETVQK